jgi:protein-disulfide isomerase
MRLRPIPVPLRLVAAAVLATACSGSSGAAPPAAASPSAAPAGGDTPVAHVDGRAITRAEVDARAAGGLQRLAQEEYELRRQALEEIVAERLLDAEAARRGVSRDALLQAEVVARTAPPTPEQMRAVFERSRDRLGGRSYADVAPQIERSLREQALGQRQADFFAQLRGRSSVQVSLEAPRAALAVPADAPALGPAQAPITIVGFLDYQCPYCHRAQSVVDQVLGRYQGQVRLVHQDFLLGRPRSLPAARAARCAGEQGRFWEYHRNLLVQPGDMSDGDLAARAAALALDRGRFSTCLASNRHDPAIEKAVADGHALGITGTPTFFVNGRRLVGAQPFEAFQQIIEDELSAGKSRG